MTKILTLSNWWIWHEKDKKNFTFYLSHTLILNLLQFALYIYSPKCTLNLFFEDIIVIMACDLIYNVYIHLFRLRIRQENRSIIYQHFKTQYFAEIYPDESCFIPNQNILLILLFCYMFCSAW